MPLFRRMRLRRREGSPPSWPSTRSMSSLVTGGPGRKAPVAVRKASGMGTARGIIAHRKACQPVQPRRDPPSEHPLDHDARKEESEDDGEREEEDPHRE